MNDEIKEILDSIKYHIEEDDWFEIEGRFLKPLLDYITNLQQENERLKTKTKEQSLLLIDYQDMEQKLEDYKSRIEKAVEYIKINFVEDIITVKTLLNILNGRSDE